MITVACLKWPRTKASLAEPGLAISRTPGWSIAAKLVKRSRLFATRQRPLPVDKGRDREARLLGPLRRDRDAAHRDVEMVGEEMIEQIDPHRGDEFEPH